MLTKGLTTPGPQTYIVSLQALDSLFRMFGDHIPYDLAYHVPLAAYLFTGRDELTNELERRRDGVAQLNISRAFATVNSSGVCFDNCLHRQSVNNVVVALLGTCGTHFCKQPWPGVSLSPQGPLGKVSYVSCRTSEMTDVMVRFAGMSIFFPQLAVTWRDAAGIQVLGECQKANGV